MSAAEPVLDFGNFYREHFTYAWRALRRLGVRERDLPDLTHDFFVVVFRQLHLYDRARPLRPWLFGIAYRVVSDYRRSARFAREVLEEPPDVADQSPPADHQMAASEGWGQVLAVLDRLDLDRRTVFIMHDIDEQPGAEIAAALAIPLATVYSRLRVAREDVAAAMKRIRMKEERARP